MRVFSLNFKRGIYKRSFLFADRKNRNNYYIIKVDKDETSIYQADNGQIVNVDVKAAASVVHDRTPSNTVERDNFLEALHYAQALFARRTAASRNLIIASCGNCLPYKISDVRKLSKELSARNIIVSSWGDYNLNLGSDAADNETPIGYSESQLYIQTGKEFVNEQLSSYKVEHEGDTCHRLAVRTHGTVFDIKQIRKADVLPKLPEWFQENRDSHTFELKKCEIVNSKLGSFADFKFSKIQHEEHSQNEDELDQLEN